MEQKLLKQYSIRKENVVLMNIICFEYILLEFKGLLDWIYAPDDEFLIKRASAIAAREKLITCIDTGNMSYKDIKEILKYDEHIEEHNIEQLAARLLFDLTRNTGFEVSKGKLGECWIQSCCEWTERQEHDKMKSIYEGTSLKEQFRASGLEVAS